MNKQAYIDGFVFRCRELGVDPKRLVKQSSMRGFMRKLAEIDPRTGISTESIYGSHQIGDSPSNHYQYNMSEGQYPLSPSYDESHTNSLPTFENTALKKKLFSRLTPYLMAFGKFGYNQYSRRRGGTPFITFRREF